MEYILLTKVGLVIKAIVDVGYLVAGSYGVRTGIRYIQDYRDSIAREREAK